MRSLGVVGLLAGLIFCAGTNGAAAAATSQSWTHQIGAGTQKSSASATWSTDAQTLQLRVTTGTLAPGKCVTVFFDWKSSAHYDARAVRDCKSNDSLSKSFTEAKPNNIVGGPNQLGVCSGSDDTKGTCQFKSGAARTIFMDWTPWPDSSRTDPCDETWVKRAANGTVTTFVDPHPTQGTLVSGRC
jgi:hypothetical protein